MKANELAFFGKIAAGVTHELKNVLAVINESNGLMADVLAMVKDNRIAYREKFERSIKKIEEQIGRGVEITTRFNRFAHSIDYPCADIDLNTIVTQTVSLAQRFAALQNVDLKAAPGNRPILLFTSAFRVQMALTRAIEAFIRCMSGSGSILVGVRDDPGPPGLDFYFEGESCQKVAKGSVEELVEWRDFVELASILDIRYEWLASLGAFALFFPIAPTGEGTT